MKIKDILQKQGEIYKNLTSNKTIEECTETIEKPKLVPYRSRKIWDYEHKAITELEKLVGRKPLINSYGNFFEIKIEDSRITYLNIENQDLRSIPNQINSLINLQTLSLPNNQITKIENLDNLMNLQRINLLYNKIQKIENLENLQDLRELFLNGNKITKKKNKKEIKILRDKGVVVFPIQEMNGELWWGDE